VARRRWQRGAAGPEDWPGSSRRSPRRERRRGPPRHPRRASRAIIDADGGVDVGAAEGSRPRPGRAKLRKRPPRRSGHSDLSRKAAGKEGGVAVSAQGRPQRRSSASIGRNRRPRPARRVSRATRRDLGAAGAGDADEAGADREDQGHRQAATAAQEGAGPLQFDTGRASNPGIELARRDIG
jgi:hypothetical protein